MLSLPGAVEANGVDAGVAAHYGNPHVEQRRLVAGEAFVDLSHRGVVRVGGPDRLSWLHSFTTQDLADLAPGAATEALILSPHGHVEHQLHLVDDGTATWTHVEPGTAPALVEFLAKMRFMLDVDPVDVTADTAVVSQPAAWPVPAGARAVRTHDDVTEVFLPRGELAAYARDHGAPAGVWAYEALRVAARRPRLGFETDHRTIPNEVGWLETAVHLDKGCYRGQETVARVNNLGHPPRRLVFLHLDGSEERLPAHGDPVELEGRQVGFVTSAARHYELGPIALALVKRTVPADAVLAAAGIPAAQEIIVAPDAGALNRARVGR
jgi:folate-binding protein YgfZ